MDHSSPLLPLTLRPTHPPSSDPLLRPLPYPLTPEPLLRPHPVTFPRPLLSPCQAGSQASPSLCSWLPPKMVSFCRALQAFPPLMSPFLSLPHAVWPPGHFPFLVPPLPSPFPQPWSQGAQARGYCSRIMLYQPRSGPCSPPITATGDSWPAGWEGAWGDWGGAEQVWG